MAANNQKPHRGLKHDEIAKHTDPNKAAQDLDAFLFFVHTRYTALKKGRIPSLGSFLINRADVIFTPNATHVSLRKNPTRQTLEILSPPVAPENEEMRRIFLLNHFGELILRYQKDAYLHVREMLLSISEPEAQEILIKEFEAYKNTITSNK